MSSLRGENIPSGKLLIGFLSLIWDKKNKTFLLFSNYTLCCEIDRLER